MNVNSLRIETDIEMLRTTALILLTEKARVVHSQRKAIKSLNGAVERLERQLSTQDMMLEDMRTHRPQLEAIRRLSTKAEWVRSHILPMIEARGPLSTSEIIEISPIRLNRSWILKHLRACELEGLVFHTNVRPAGTVSRSGWNGYYWEVEN